MAFTKVSLTGTIDTIKAAFTRFNTFIDELVSTSNGLGASQVGIEDNAGNMSSDNVEDALAEIYTDTASARGFADDLDENDDTTTGLTWGYKSGDVAYGNVITTVTAGTVGLTDDATNYIMVDETGTVTKSLSGFTAGKAPLRTIVTASGSQISSTDKRALVRVAAVYKIVAITIDDGSDASTISVSVASMYAGSTISSEDNLAKGGSTTNFTLSADGNDLTVSASGLGSGQVLGVTPVIAKNASGTALTVTTGAAAGALGISFWDATAGTVADLTSLVDTGAITVYAFFVVTVAS